MMVLFALFLVQCFIAVIVLLFLNGRLHRELVEIGLEELGNATFPAETAVVKVICARPLDESVRLRVSGLVGRKAAQADVQYEQDPQLRGGIVIHWPDGGIDLSLATRLKNL